MNTNLINKPSDFVYVVIPGENHYFYQHGFCFSTKSSSLGHKQDCEYYYEYIQNY